MKAGRIMDFSASGDEDGYYIDITIETSHENYEKIRITHESEEDFELGVHYWGAIFMASEAVHESGLFSPDELEADEPQGPRGLPKFGQSRDEPSNPFFNFGIIGRK
jgi:hypothetical protein